MVDRGRDPARAPDPPLRWARARVDADARLGLRRRLHSRAGGSHAHAIVDGHRVVVFSANDYLGLATRSEVVRAAVEATAVHGVGSTGSRHLSGCHDAIDALEDDLCTFLSCPTATVAPSGHAANLAVLTALGGLDAVILSDERNHASIVDGCRLSRSRVEVYRHRDLDDLARRLRHVAERPIIVSDTVFSVDGTVADVAGLASLARRHDAWLVLDEAHAIGTIGPGGRGAAAAAGVDPGEPNLVRVVTLGKALGSSGAAVCGVPEVRDLLLQRGRALIFSTAPAHPAVAAARAALGVLSREPELVTTLQARAAQLRSALRQLNPGGVAPVPIVPVGVADPHRAVEAETVLLDRGYLVQAVRPPTVPAGDSRLRLCAAVSHNADDIDGVARALVDVLTANGAGVAAR